MAERKTTSQKNTKPGKPAVAAKRDAFTPSASGVRDALETGKVGVWVWDVAKNTNTWSLNLEEIHGLPENSFDGSFNFFESDIHADDRDAVMSAIQRSLQEGGPYQVRYRLPPKNSHEERWIEAKGGAVRSRGVTKRMLGVCQDVTDRVKVEYELLARARQQELVARLGSESLTESDLSAFLNKAAQRVAQELGVELVKVLELLPGDREFFLRAGTGWSPGLVGKAHVPADLQSQAGYTLSNGTPVIVDDLRVETRFTGPPLLHDHGVVSGLSVIIYGRDGRPLGVIGAHTTKRRRFGERDVSFLGSVANVIAAVIEQRLSDSRQNLLIRELRHRSGNLFSQLLALFSQSARTSTSIQDLATKFEARVMALANAHKLITEGGWQATSFQQILNVLLAPFSDRINFEGPDLYLDPDPAFGLSAAIHELATNASKYGALSNGEGQLDLSWSVARSEQGPFLKIDWRERGGPAPAEARTAGFGSKLIKAVIERQLNGKVEQNFAPEGLQADISIPLGHERWPQNRPVTDALDGLPPL